MILVFNREKELGISQKTSRKCPIDKIGHFLLPFWYSLLKMVKGAGKMFSRYKATRDGKQLFQSWVASYGKKQALFLLRCYEKLQDKELNKRYTKALLKAMQKQERRLGK